MKLEDLGYSADLEDYRKANKLDAFAVGRVISEHKERYIVKTADAEFDAELIGNMRFSAQERSDFPAVGDWVALSEYDEGKALIHAVYPRQSVIERQAVGKHGEIQIIATNIDSGLIIVSVNRDFNVNRVERYLTICNAGGIEPIIILSKIDLIDAETLQSLQEQILQRIKTVRFFPVSNFTQSGMDELRSCIEPRKTYCLLGSSGVGKSSLINALAGTTLMETGDISSSIDRGKHVTTHRELMVLENGAIFIDNPGMREVGITNSEAALALTFDEILERAQDCKFRDCTHTSEDGCAIISAVNAGEIDQESYANFMKMEREKLFFESTVADKRKKDKDFGKMVKNVKKNIKLYKR